MGEEARQAMTALPSQEDLHPGVSEYPQFPWDTRGPCGHWCRWGWVLTSYRRGPHDPVLICDVCSRSWRKPTER